MNVFFFQFAKKVSMVVFPGKTTARRFCKNGVSEIATV